ncbi:hypothetical protein IL306_010826, partial [Fusarium sp. DS 682]
MMTSYHRFVRAKVLLVEKNPLKPTAKPCTTSVSLRATLLDDGADLHKPFGSGANDGVDALENGWTLLEEREADLPQLDEVLQILVASTYELQAVADRGGHLRDIDAEEDEVIRCAQSVDGVHCWKPGWYRGPVI